jgi:hypothetical protein
MTITPSPGEATPSAPQAARIEQATPLSMTKRTRAKAAMKISVPGVRPRRWSSRAPDEKSPVNDASPPVTPPLG